MGDLQGEFSSCVDAAGDSGEQQQQQLLTKLLSTVTTLLQQQLSGTGKAASQPAETHAIVTDSYDDIEREAIAQQNEQC